MLQAANGALDQREKVKAKLAQAGRDAAYEKSHRLSQLAELMHKANALDAEYKAKLGAMDEQEQARRRRAYNAGKTRRVALAQAETKAGFLQSQVVGWDSEFARLQEFTGMDKRFAPGDEQTIGEITSRYVLKDQQNTSLLRFLHSQQAEVHALEAELKTASAAATALEDELQQALDSEAAPELDYEGLAQREADAAAKIEAELAALCERTAAITEDLLAHAPDGGAGSAAAPRPPPIAVGTLEEHLKLHEDISARLHEEWRRKYGAAKVRMRAICPAAAAARLGGDSRARPSAFALHAPPRRCARKTCSTAGCSPSRRAPTNRSTRFTSGC